MSGMRLNALIEFCPKETIARSIRRRKSMMMNNGEDEAGRRQLLHLLRLLYPIQHVHYQWRQLWIAKRLGLQLEASIQTLHPSTWNTYSISVNRIVILKMEHYKNTFRWTKYICPKGGKYKSRSRCLKIPQKSIIHCCERSELSLHFEWTKVHQKCQKWLSFSEFLKTWSFRPNSVTKQVDFK